MKKLELSALYVLRCLVVGGCLLLSAFSAYAVVPRVIIDTDLGSSMDDLWTIDFAARMHKAGKLDFMAVMMNRPRRQ